MKKTTLRHSLPLMLVSALLISSSAFADGSDYVPVQQEQPITFLVNFQITGTLNGDTTNGAVYTVNGKGYAPEFIFPNGEVSNAIRPRRQVAILEGAQITFMDPPSSPIVRFTCLPGSCKMIFKDGSVLESDAGVPLEGRAINMWGPVIKSPSYVPNQILPIRILGCGGLKEVNGKGAMAGMVGSVCFNGIMNFNMLDMTSLTGGSKCTITMHTPADPSSIP